MSKPTTAAHFVAYGVSAETINNELSDDDLGRINARLHQMLTNAGLDVESVALVSGDRADELLAFDRTRW